MKVNSEMVDVACSAYLYQTCPVVPDAMRAALEAALAPYEAPPFELSEMGHVFMNRVRSKYYVQHPQCSREDLFVAADELDRACETLGVAQAAPVGTKPNGNPAVYPDLMPRDTQPEAFHAAAEAYCCFVCPISGNKTGWVSNAAMDYALYVYEQHRKAAPVGDLLTAAERAHVEELRPRLVDGENYCAADFDAVYDILDRIAPPPSAAPAQRTVEDLRWVIARFPESSEGQAALNELVRRANGGRP